MTGEQHRVSFYAVLLEIPKKVIGLSNRNKFLSLFEGRVLGLTRKLFLFLWCFGGFVDWPLGASGVFFNNHLQLVHMQTHTLSFHRRASQPAKSGLAPDTLFVGWFCCRSC